VEFMSFRPRLRCHYLPRMQETGGLYLPFDPIRAAATSLAYNSESDVSFHGLAPPLPPHATASRTRSTPFALPPYPSHAIASRSLSGS